MTNIAMTHQKCVISAKTHKIHHQWSRKKWGDAVWEEAFELMKEKEDLDRFNCCKWSHVGNKMKSWSCTMFDKTPAESSSTCLFAQVIKASLHQRPCDIAHAIGTLFKHIANAALLLMAWVLKLSCFRFLLFWDDAFTAYFISCTMSVWHEAPFSLLKWFTKIPAIELCIWFKSLHAKFQFEIGLKSVFEALRVTGSNENDFFVSKTEVGQCAPSCLSSQLYASDFE